MFTGVGKIYVSLQLYCWAMATHKAHKNVLWLTVLENFSRNFYIWSAIVNGTYMQKNHDKSPSKISS